MTRWAKLGDVVSDHMWKQPALWSRRSHCSCGWTGGADESWIGHVATQLDSALEREDATACVDLVRDVEAALVGTNEVMIPARVRAALDRHMARAAGVVSK